MSSQAKGHLIGVLFIAAIAAVGVYIVLAGLGRFGRSSGDAPGWVLVAAGAAFLAAAASFGLSAFGGALYGARARPDGSLSDEAPCGLRAAQIAIGLSIVALLASVATWVALHPEPGSSTGRKVVFAVGAAMVWAIFLGFAVLRLRHLRR